MKQATGACSEGRGLVMKVNLTTPSVFKEREIKVGDYVMLDEVKDVDLPRRFKVIITSKEGYDLIGQIMAIHSLQESGVHILRSDRGSPGDEINFKVSNILRCERHETDAPDNI